MRRSTTILLLLLAACSPEVTQRAHPAPSHASKSSAQDLAPQDRDFLERAAEGGNAEIAIGDLPPGRTQNAAVLSFGKMMIAQHSASNRQLVAIALKKKISLPASLGEHQASWDRLDGRTQYDFDVEFAKVMVDDHNQAAELFRSEASGGADPEIRALAASTLPMIEAHLQQAKALATLLQ
jgi:putative membrane protein